MYCKRCGNQIKEGLNFCTVCGQVVESNDTQTANNNVNQVNATSYQQPVQSTQYNWQPTYAQQQPKKKLNIFAIIGIFFGVMIVVGIIIFAVVSLTSKKLVCKSSQGNITIMYKKDKLTGYKLNGYLTYDLDTAKQYVQQNGIDKYLDAFKSYFEVNLNGTCEYK